MRTGRLTPLRMCRTEYLGTLVPPLPLLRLWRGSGELLKHTDLPTHNADDIGTSTQGN